MAPVSWDEGFADRYAEWSAGRTADIPFYVDLARKADGPLVELAVGSGRVAIPVALATGRPVIGIDSSPSMLAQAREAAAVAGVRLDLREGDMRDLVLDEPAALRPDGRFAWDAFAFDHHTAVRLDGGHQQEPVPHTTRFSVGDNRIDLTLDGGGTSSLWWATKNEWLGLIDVAGLEVEALYGGFAGEPFTGERSEYVFVARRRPPSRET